MSSKSPHISCGSRQKSLDELHLPPGPRQMILQFILTPSSLAFQVHTDQPVTLATRRAGNIVFFTAPTDCMDVLTAVLTVV